MGDNNNNHRVWYKDCQTVEEYDGLLQMVQAKFQSYGPHEEAIWAKVKQWINGDVVVFTPEENRDVLKTYSETILHLDGQARTRFNQLPDGSKDLKHLLIKLRPGGYGLTTNKAAALSAAVNTAFDRHADGDLGNHLAAVSHQATTIGNISAASLEEFLVLTSLKNDPIVGAQAILEFASRDPLPEKITRILNVDAARRGAGGEDDAHANHAAPTPPPNNTGNRQCYRCGQRGHAAGNCTATPEAAAAFATARNIARLTDRVEAMTLGVQNKGKGRQNHQNNNNNNNNGGAPNNGGGGKFGKGKPKGGNKGGKGKGKPKGYQPNSSVRKACNVCGKEHVGRCWYQ